MPTSRFYIPATEWNPDDLMLHGGEAHHCREVLRHREGDKVSVFNGEGREASATIARMGRYEIHLEPTGISRSARLTTRLTLAQAIPKGKNMELILQKSTELGVAKIQPLLSERTVVKLEPRDREKKAGKWQRVVVEACKQCGQNWLPLVLPPLTVSEYIAESWSADALPLIASLQPGARPLHELLPEWKEMHNNGSPTEAMIAIGPEGDFTPAEVAQALNAGCLPMTLGPIVLRSETAALYALSVIGYELFR